MDRRFGCMNNTTIWTIGYEQPSHYGAHRRADPRGRGGFG
jgi:hypothetical protein